MQVDDQDYSTLTDSNRETFNKFFETHKKNHFLIDTVSRKMLANYFITIATFVAIANADNVGWKSYFVENPTEFHDIPLSWESGNQSSVPSWLSGVYVRNGPAQVINFFIIFINQNLNYAKFFFNDFFLEEIIVFVCYCSSF